MVYMTDEKLFYKYQSFEGIKDIKGNSKQYIIENLANNQLYFQHPREYNDPFDSLIRYYSECTIEEFINKAMKASRFPGTREQCLEKLEKSIKEDIYKRNGNLIRANYDARDFFHLPLTCCFSETKDNILMWSHYAKHHKGVCLSFKSKLIKGLPYLTINSKPVRLYPMKYEKKAPNPMNLHNQTEEMGQMSKFLSTKPLDWIYESEYRIFLERDVAKGNLNEFKKEELEGVILGARANFDDVNEIYKTINKHYLSKGINVKFYVEEIIPEEYKVLPKEIDIKKYLQTLFGRMQLEEEHEREQRIQDQLECQQRTLGSKFRYPSDGW